MAKVANPLFADFREAFADVIVYQGNGCGSVIARQKVKHPTNQRSAHYPTRIDKWGQAVDAHQKDAAPDAELINYVARIALPPDRPANLRTVALSEDPEDPNKQLFTIMWDAPTTKYNGHSLDNLYGYFIEYTFDFVSWIRLNREPITQTEFSGSIPNGQAWFIVLAVDTEGNVSSPSQEMLLELTVLTAWFDQCFFDKAYFVGPGPSDEESFFNSCHFNMIEFV